MSFSPILSVPPFAVIPLQLADRIGIIQHKEFFVLLIAEALLNHSPIEWFYYSITKNRQPKLPVK